MKKVFLVGAGPRAFELPEDSEVWAFNAAGILYYGRWNRWFHLHGAETMRALHTDAKRNVSEAKQDTEMMMLEKGPPPGCNIYSARECGFWD